jgi:hypothetical protein
MLQKMLFKKLVSRKKDETPDKIEPILTRLGTLWEYQGILLGGYQENQKSYGTLY